MHFLLRKVVPYGHYGRTMAPQAKRNGCVHCRKMWRFELHGAREAPAPRPNAVTRARYPVVWVAGTLQITVRMLCVGGGVRTCGQRTKPQAFTLKNNGPHSRVRSTRITRRRPTPGRNANSKFRPPGHPPPCASLLSLPLRRRPGARCGVAPPPRRRIPPP